MRKKTLIDFELIFSLPPMTIKCSRDLCSISELILSNSFFPTVMTNFPARRHINSVNQAPQNNIPPSGVLSWCIFPLPSTWLVVSMWLPGSGWSCPSHVCRSSARELLGPTVTALGCCFLRLIWSSEASTVELETASEAGPSNSLTEGFVFVIRNILTVWQHSHQPPTTSSNTHNHSAVSCVASKLLLRGLEKF